MNSAKNLIDLNKRAALKAAKKIAAQVRASANYQAVQTRQVAAQELKQLVKRLQDYAFYSAIEGKRLKPYQFVGMMQAEVDRVIGRLKAESEASFGRRLTVYRTIAEQIVADLTSMEMSAVRYTTEESNRMIQTELSEKARPVLGLDFTMDSPFAKWDSAKKLLFEGYTADMQRYVGSQAKSFLVDWYSEYYAKVINLFFDSYSHFVDPMTGKAVHSHRLINAFGVQFGPTANEMHVGLFGNRYLRWVAYTLEDGGTIRPTKRRVLTIPNPDRLPPVHRPPWRRARLYSNAKLIIFKRRRSKAIGAIANISPDNKLDVLFFLHEQVRIPPKRFWSKSVRLFDRRFSSLIPQIESMTYQQWERMARANRKRSTFRIRDLSDPVLTARFVRRAPLSSVPVVTRDSGPRMMVQPPNVRYFRVKTVVSPKQIRPIIQKLIR